MSYRWPTLGLSLFATFVLAAPTPAADPEIPKSPDAKIDQILRELRDLRTAVDNLDRVRADLKSLQTQEELRGQTLNERIDRVNDRIGGLEGRIKRLESDLDAMRAQATTANRVSAYSGLGNGAAPPLAAAPPGTIRLSNTFPDMVSVVVDGTSYRLMPGESVDLPNHAPGPFWYEVVNIQPRRTVTLRPNETFTITVFPR